MKMSKIELTIKISPGEEKLLKAQDGEILIVGTHNTDFVRLLQEVDRACAQWSVAHPFTPAPFEFQKLFLFWFTMPPSLRRALKENPIA